MHQPESRTSSFRLDVLLDHWLTTPVSERVEFLPVSVPQRFPDPVFTHHTELLGALEEGDGWHHLRRGVGRLPALPDGAAMPLFPIRSRVTPSECVRWGLILSDMGRAKHRNLNDQSASVLVKARRLSASYSSCLKEIRRR